MTSTQTARREMPPELMAAMKQFMEENELTRVDFRLNGAAGEPEDEDDSGYKVVMSDDEEPDSLTRDAGVFLFTTSDLGIQQ